LFKTSKKIWLTWHFATRSRNLADELNLELFEYFENNSLLKRHLYSSFWTVKILVKNRPKTIFIQLSFLLLVIVVFYKILMFGKIIVVADCHTKALRRKAEGFSNFIFWPIKKITFKFVDLAIVSNNGMVKDIEKLNRNYTLLPDKIPIIKAEKNDKSLVEKYCVYVSAFAVDEPFTEIFETAELLPNEVKLYWTGKMPNHYKLPEYVPTNIVFTGYVDFEEYFNLITNANCILALTTEEDCLQSGAYEALSVNVPMVISDTKALREYFSKAAIYTDHNPQNIASNILYAIENSELQKENILEIKCERNKEFNKQIDQLNTIIN
jgi:glycosyltransferase involved in cell wall biosynthesis